MSLRPLRYMHKRPAVPESDFAGIVAGGDLTGTDLKLGDKVFGCVLSSSSFFQITNLTVTESLQLK